MNNKICAGVWDFGMGSCRYVGEGYKPYMNFEERVRAIAKIPGIAGIEITYPNDINENTWPQAKELLDECGLELAGMGVELVCDKQWKDGSLSSPDENRRQISVELVKKAMDFAAIAGVKTVSLWLGQDGFDYVFQQDYQAAYRNLIDSLKECAAHNPDVNLGLEYKVSEPKMSCLVRNAGMALAISQATGCPNVGVTLDVGHAFNAGENPAEVAAILMAENRLFHLHLNDNYRIADDDMPVGAVHWPQYFELFRWLQKTCYAGWFSLDLYPYRDDPSAACAASVKFIRGAERFAQKLDISGAKAPSDILGKMFEQFFGEAPL